jgi:hypothetical protein
MALNTIPVAVKVLALEAIIESNARWGRYHGSFSNGCRTHSPNLAELRLARDECLARSHRLRAAPLAGAGTVFLHRFSVIRDLSRGEDGVRTAARPASASVAPSLPCKPPPLRARPGLWRVRLGNQIMRPVHRLVQRTGHLHVNNARLSCRGSIAIIWSPAPSPWSAGVWRRTGALVVRFDRLARKPSSKAKLRRRFPTRRH